MLIGLLVVTGTVMSPMNLVWADTILCNGFARCFGTEGDDTMIGDDGPNRIVGNAGNDNIVGKGGEDEIAGAGGDDVMSGGKGNDQIRGDFGADKLVGGDGDDKIFHNRPVLGANPTNPEESKDIIDCGPGNDEAWINVSFDHDTASGCEIVHAG